MEEKSRWRSFLDKVFNMQHIGFLVSLILFISGIFAIALGIKNLFRSFRHVFIHQTGKPGVHLIETVDTLLFALVILILSGGIYKLFVGNETTFKKSPVFSRLNSFKDLKVLLWETILLTLTVWTSLSFFLDEVFTWEQLILPACVLMLALALRILKDGGHRSKGD